jgi:predicted dithiol-disulfide oxidoreductase (DUF899 family)
MAETEHLHDVRFPGESPEYRAARDALLRDEIDLRRRIEAVAARRRTLPLGGRPPEDYVFSEGVSDAIDGPVRPVRLSELFSPGLDTLVLYSFMYGPEMAKACPSCTSILDALDGEVPHLLQRVGLAVVAKSPLPRIKAHARARGWRKLRLLSSEGNSYNHDYHGETEDGDQIPALNVFVRRGSEVRHIYCTEVMFAPSDPGQDPRHVDSIWPLWNVFDLTPQGRGDWHPALSYEAVKGASGPTGA